jgi:predicted acylesterase/phospholipase RssA
MNKIGLALSGGGFRATLYHLGLVRFLRDAGILSRVTHITSVSGGSVIAAHLVLNWDRYNGSPTDFDAAAAELLAFVQMDVRNRILRRFPLNLPFRWPRRLIGLSNRKLSRIGLLESHYEKYLYGDTSLFQLPETPQLHILATNLSEGCLCSFNRDGLVMVRRQPDRTVRLDRIRMGLATVPMAVTASSAFPGFFPPMELTAADVGASGGEFVRQAFTDGGVFDNLGVRMFRCLERPMLVDMPLSLDDFYDLPAVVEALRQARGSKADTPLHRLTQVLAAMQSSQAPLPRSGEGSVNITLPPAPAATTDYTEEQVAALFWKVKRWYQFHHDPLFAELALPDPDAEALRRAARPGGRVLDQGDQLWLNRQLLDAAFRQATGRPCFRRLNSVLDAVLVSDVGKAMEVQAGKPAGGLIRTAMRATDIVMDRVWQLEIETFQDTPGFVFAPVTAVVEQSEDPTALHPELQRQACNIRTDLDRFSPLEISILVRHGYVVGRNACRSRPDLFGTDLPANAPWDPVSAPPAASPVGPTGKAAAANPRDAAPTTVDTRKLHGSATRRIWSTLLDFRDWTSWIYVPIIVPILIGLPYVVYKSYQRSHMLNKIVHSLAQGSRDLDRMTQLIESRPEPWAGDTHEEVDKLKAPDHTSFKIYQDSVIVDLRAWKPGREGRADPKSTAYAFHRLKVLKEHENPGGSTIFRVPMLPTSPQTAFRFPPQRLHPRLSMMNVGSALDQNGARWQAEFDFKHVPDGEFVDLYFDYHSSGLYLQRGDNGTEIAVPLQAEVAELTMWILMPEGREYRSFGIVRQKTGEPEDAEDWKVVTEYLADDYSILAFKLLALKPGYTYVVSWLYK